MSSRSATSHTRLNAAKTLLTTTDRRITDIAQKTGIVRTASGVAADDEGAADRLRRAPAVFGLSGPPYLRRAAWAAARRAIGTRYGEQLT